MSPFIIDRVLTEATNLLKTKGWVQRVMKNNSGFCALGAVRTATEKVKLTLTVEERINPENYEIYSNIKRFLEYILDDKDCMNIIVWNDQEGRTKEEVIALFTKAKEINNAGIR